MNPRSLCLIFWGVLASPLLAGNAEPWKEFSRKPELTIYTRSKKGSDVKEIKAIGTIDAPPGALCNVLSDVPHYPEFMPYVAEAKILRQEKDSNISYQHLAMPLVADRDYTIRVRIESRPSPDGGTSYFRRWESANELGPPEKPGIVRVKINQGSWTLEPLDAGRRTKVTYFIYTDPVGSLPGFVINSANTRAIPKLFEAIRKASSAKKYRTPPTVASKPPAPAQP